VATLRPTESSRHVLFTANVQLQVYVHPLSHSQTPKIQYGCNLDYDHTLSEGIVAVFLEARGQAFYKSPELHLQPRAKYSKFHPGLQNLANYDKASNDLK